MTNLTQKFELHYYLKDNSHAMNAFVRNKAEKDFLEAVKRIGELLDSELQIETEAYQEGGLIEILTFSGFIIDRVLNYLSPALNDIITHYATRDTQSEKLDNKIKELTIKNLELDSKKKELEIEEQINKKLDDKLTKKYISNFYKKIDAYKKVEKIGYKSVEKDATEYIVERKDFKSFILHDDITISEDDDAMIEIISPVLKEGKYNWRGKYKNEKIKLVSGVKEQDTNINEVAYITRTNSELINLIQKLDDFDCSKNIDEVFGLSLDIYKTFISDKKDDFKSLLSFKNFCIEKYRNKIITNCCPTLIFGNQLKINEKGFLESYYDDKKIDITPDKAKKLWKILFENQEVIGLIKDSSIQLYIGKFIKTEIINSATNTLEKFIYQIHDYKEEENKYRLYFKDIITKQIGKSNKLYILEDIEKLPFINEEDIQNGRN